MSTSSVSSLSSSFGAVAFRDDGGSAGQKHPELLPILTIKRIEQDGDQSLDLAGTV